MNFIDYKETLEKANYTIVENEVLAPQGQPVAGVDAYGQVWYKDRVTLMMQSQGMFARPACFKIGTSL